MQTSLEYKPCVTELHPGLDGFFRIVFGNYYPDRVARDETIRKPAKRAFAALRKDIKAYSIKENIPDTFWTVETYTDVQKGDWRIHKDALLYFKDRMQFIRPLDEMIAAAEDEGRLRRDRHDKEWKEFEDEVKQWAFDRDFNDRIREREEAFYTFPWWGSDSSSDVEMALKTFSLSLNATKDDIKKRYRELARQYHPDTGGDETKFKELNKANTVLMKWRGTS